MVAIGQQKWIPAGLLVRRQEGHRFTPAFRDPDHPALLPKNDVPARAPGAADETNRIRNRLYRAARQVRDLKGTLGKRIKAYAPGVRRPEWSHGVLCPGNQHALGGGQVPDKNRGTRRGFAEVQHLGPIGRDFGAIEELARWSMEKKAHRRVRGRFFAEVDETQPGRHDREDACRRDPSHGARTGRNRNSRSGARRLSRLRALNRNSRLADIAQPGTDVTVQTSADEFADGTRRIGGGWGEIERGREHGR